MAEQVNQPETITELFNQAQENLKARGIDRPVPEGSNYQAAAQLQRRLLDSIFMETRYLDPIDPDTSSTLLGVKMETPVFCSALSKPGNVLSNEEMAEIARGLGKAGAMMMLGMCDSRMLQSAIDTGAPVVKIVKPYQNTELMYERAKDAAERGCVAVGMDIDYFYGPFRDGAARTPGTYASWETQAIGQALSATKLPFIIKGVLSVQDARKAVEMGASAIIVSTHIWSSFDFAVPSIISLPKIVKEVGSEVAVLVDSGFRTGNDVFKALALGAKGVGFTTSLISAVAAGGAEGVERFIGFINGELTRTMANCGYSDLSSIDDSALVLSPELKQWW